MGENKVVYITGPPGSGKTDYLYKNLKEIIKSKKAKPEEILFFTFNDKIAEEVKERLIKWTEEGFAELWINSFSSFCKKILRDNYYQLSTLPQKTFLGPNFQIIGGMEEKLVLKRLLEETSLNLKFYAKAKSSVFFINEMVNFVDLIKQNLHKLKRLKEEGGKFAELEKIFYKYNTQLHKSDYLDLRDLTLQTIDLFKGRKDVFETYRKKFKYVLVDDFEDIDYQQFRLLQIFAEDKSDLIVAGNVKESIFSFRGARPEEIKKKFIQQFNPQIITITPKANVSSAKILPYKFDTGKEESFFIARRIYKLIREKNKKGETLYYKDFLILSRDIGKETDSLVNALSFYRIPCIVLGGTGFFKQPLIISLISVLQVIDKFKKKNLSNFHVIWALTTLNF
ncbi:UvrD-helicase domain-containing protein, partial [bacterium]|nr:UvrD-helicase domain-containing protein [bacterium]